MKKEDFVIGEFYTHTNGNIVRWDCITGGKHLGDGSSNFNSKTSGNFKPGEDLRKASKKEKHWLTCCIEANEFISYEEAMKTFKEEPENTSLVGRYLKALVSEPEYTNFKAGDYVKIKSLRKTNAYEVTLDGLLAWGASPSKKDLWELMPISWSPDEEGKVNDEIPEYVKCIKGHNCSFHNKVGTIYKVENYDLKNKKLQLENFDNTISYIDFKNPISSNLTDYIISSKAEYDLQNKPKEMDKKEEFKKGDYIVTLKGNFGGNCAKENYCFKQRINHTGIRPEVDLNNNLKNGHDVMSFDKKERLYDWRYATAEEITEYNLRGKPYDVTTLTTKQYDYEVVHCTTQEEWDFACDKYNKGIYVKEQFVKYGYNTFMMSNFSGWNKKEFFLSDSLYNESLKIYTFKEYCDKFGYTPDFIEKEEWIPQIGEWVVALETIGDLITKNKIYQLKKVDSFGFYHLCDDGTTNGYDSSKYRLAFPHEIPNNQQNDQTIDIGDTVSTSDGNGIVIGITTSNKYLVKGAYKFHNGKGNTLIKGNFSDKDDSYYYDLDELTLVKKANKSYIDIAEETVKLVYNVQLPIIGNIPTKTIFTFDIDIPKIKKDTIIELDTNLLKNIKKPIKF